MPASGPAFNMVVGSTFRLGQVSYTVDYAPAQQDSLFDAVLHSGLLPDIHQIDDLRRLLYNFAQGLGRPIASRLMALFSRNTWANFDDYVERLLIPGAETDNFDVVLLAVFAKINLIVFKRSSIGFSAFNAMLFLSREVRLHSPPLTSIASTRQIYLFQVSYPNAAIGPSTYYLYLRREPKAIASDTGRSAPKKANATAAAAVEAVVQNHGIEVAAAAAPGGRSGPQTTRTPVGDLPPRLKRTLSTRDGRSPATRPMGKRQRSDDVMFNAEIGSDVRLLVASRVFCVHRSILTENCGCFRDFFRSECYARARQNRQWNGRDILFKMPDFGTVPVLDGSDSDDGDDSIAVFQTFLALLYNATLVNTVATPALIRVVVLARRCDSDRIARLCDAELAHRFVQVCPSLLAFSQRYELGQLRTAQLGLLDGQILDSFQLIGQLSDRDVSDYLQVTSQRPPVMLLTVALIYVCGLDSNNQIRKRGEYYEIGRRQAQCKRWVHICASKCLNMSELVDLYALIRKTRLLLPDGRYDDVSLRDAVMMPLSRTETTANNGLRTTTKEANAVKTASG